ncbi:MAG: redox-sensing transcriptional repressor Rex [Armatimonadota bacterium]|nr:redox-sensing transcriptional repressor Rex [Armatimonadota bacterium]
MNENVKVPVPTLTRLATYFSVLREAEENGIRSLNSARIEGLCGIAATQIRKDLSRFGELGKPGVGYEVTQLREHIGRILKLDRVQKVVIIGAGRLGQALAAYPGLADYSFEVVGLFDSDPKKIGKNLSGHLVSDIAKLSKMLPGLGARIVALAVPASAAQGAAEAAIKGGARWLLNFSPTHIKTPPNCLVRDVSFTQEFAVLAHYSEDR